MAFVEFLTPWHRPSTFLSTRRYDLCLHLEQAVVKFARTHRYGLGTELWEGARRVLRLVVRANARGEKMRVSVHAMSTSMPLVSNATDDSLIRQLVITTG